MLDVFAGPFHTLGEHVGAGIWAMAVFVAGFLLAIAVVRSDVRSLLVFPMWLRRLGRKYLTPDTSPVFLCAFIFVFNTAAIFCYMISGGLIFLPIAFDLFTGLNVGVIMLKEAQEPSEEPGHPEGSPPPARAWVGFLGIFVVVVEMTSFWLAIGMGIKLGYAMRAAFSWATFTEGVGPRILAYALILVPALAASAAAEAAAIRAMLRKPDQ